MSQLGSCRKQDDPKVVEEQGEIENVFLVGLLTASAPNPTWAQLVRDGAEPR